MLKALADRAARTDRQTPRSSRADGDYTARLALLEECKTLPFGAVWDYYCAQSRRAGRRGVDERSEGVRAKPF